jgi:preprotein translocase subunit SecD
MTKAPMRDATTMIISQRRKAGLAGFFLAVALLTSALPTSAQPIQLEVVAASAAFDPRTNQPVVTYRLAPASAKVFAELTTKNVGRPMAFIVDGRVTMKSVIREPIIGGSVQIAGHLTADEAKMLAERLASGKARLEVEVVD